jgi:hypothetical protein
MSPPSTLFPDSSTRVSGAMLTMQEIVDTSGNCGGSYSVVVVSPDFRKKMTLARHKLGKWIYRTPSQPQLVNGHAGSLQAIRMSSGMQIVHADS